MENTESTNTKSSGQNLMKEIVQWILAILIAVVLALIIRGFIFEQALVIGESMKDTLQDRQRLIVYKLGYYMHTPERGDIIVLEYQKGLFKYLPFPDPGEVDYIKRIIGLPGETVDIKDGHVYINGKQLNEPYALGTTETNGADFPEKVPPNKVFVLGDNRENSSDSRQIGMIDYSRIRGKAAFRILPFNVFGSIYANKPKDILGTK